MLGLRRAATFCHTPGSLRGVWGTVITRLHASSSAAPHKLAAATTFANEAAYLAAVSARSSLPRGFRVGVGGFAFHPAELPTKEARMNLTLIVADEPTPNFAAMFTRNALPGAPVLIGRSRLEAPAVQAIVVNNKISNVCAPGGCRTVRQCAPRRPPPSAWRPPHLSSRHPRA